MKTIQTKELSKGIALLVGFAVILVLLFSPIFNGQTPMTFLDSLYNSISKGSVYYIDDLMIEAESYKDKDFQVELKFNDVQTAKTMARLFKINNVIASQQDSAVLISGNIGEISLRILEDSDSMFNNQGDQIQKKYNYMAKQVFVDWWTASSSLIKELNRQKQFEAAKFMNSVLTRGIECSYNYYGITPEAIADKALLVILSLCFYVIYTVWFGFSIMFMFLGLGFKLEH